MVVNIMEAFSILLIVFSVNLQSEDKTTSFKMQ